MFGPPEDSDGSNDDRRQLRGGPQTIFRVTRQALRSNNLAKIVSVPARDLRALGLRCGRTTSKLAR